MGGKIGSDQIERLANLQYRRRVGDILRRRAPVAILAEPVFAPGGELLHEAEHRRADALGVLREACSCRSCRAPLGTDLRRGVRRDDAETSLHGSQRSFEFQIFSDATFVGENLAHRFTAEGIAEQGRVDRGRRHADLLSRARARECSSL